MSTRWRIETIEVPYKSFGGVLTRATHDSTRKPISESFRDEMEPQKY